MDQKDIRRYSKNAAMNSELSKRSSQQRRGSADMLAQLESEIVECENCKHGLLSKRAVRQWDRLDGMVGGLLIAKRIVRGEWRQNDKAHVPLADSWRDAERKP